MSDLPAAANRVTVALDAADDARLTRLTNDLAEQADPEPGRDAPAPSREDLLRALLVVAERNAGVRSAVRAEVRTDVVRRDPAGEITAVADALLDLAPRLTTPEGADGATTEAATLGGVAATAPGDPTEASERLHQVALAVERLGARHGGHDLLRPVLALADRLEVVRDAIDPSAKTRCSACNRPVRALAGGRPEEHNDQTRSPCSGVP